MQSTAIAARAERLPFTPQDLDASKLVVRAALAHCISAVRGGEHPADAARRLWPKDLATLQLITRVQSTHANVVRAAVPPASTTGSGWADAIAAQSTGAFIGSLLPSAGASLINAGTVFDLSGMVKINLPHSTNVGVARWVSEGAPIPAGQGSLATVAVGPPTKLALIFTISREIAEHSAQNGEATMSLILRDAGRLALDAALFSATAGVAGLNPPGLLNGVTPTTASTAAAGSMACLSDVRALTDAIVAGGAGQDVRFFASPGRAKVAKAYMPDLSVYASSSIPAGEFIAIDVAAFASGFDGMPTISAAIEGLIHMEDTTPQPIGTPGSPNVVAAPTRSLFQTDVIGLKMILRAAWALRAPGAVAFISTGMNW